MASKIIMPKQGLQMETGIITSWLHREGEEIKEGEPLFEIETDKLTITIDALAGGTLLKILYDEGAEVPVATVIAIVGEPGEDISALLAEAGAPGGAPEGAAEEAPARAAEETKAEPAAPGPAAAPGGRVFITPRAKTAAEERGIDYSGIRGTGGDGLIIERDVLACEAAKPRATPLAANEAKARGLDLAGVKGTGAGGKITLADLPGREAPPRPATQEPAPQRPARGTRTEPMSGMRKAVSRNMLASKETNAQASHRMLVDMTALIALREAHKAQGVKVSYNDMLIRICAKALMEMPVVNASIDGNSVVYHDYANVGLAVSVPGGLIVPVVRDADLLTVPEIALRTKELVDKAKGGTLGPDEYRGGTFTVTSLGMFDVDDFVAIINPPESAILAVGKILKTPVVITNARGEDEICIRPMCALCLSYDHRLIDGAEAAKFLQRIKKYAQEPALML